MTSIGLSRSRKRDEKSSPPLTLRGKQAARPRRAHLAAEALEDRAVPAVITVTSTGDAIALDGFVTLREAITAANVNAASGDAPAGDPGLDTIRFNIAGAPGTVHTIQPTAALPAITEAIFIDGYSQLGATPNTLADGDKIGRASCRASK